MIRASLNAAASACAVLNQTVVDTKDRAEPVHHHRIVDRRFRRHHSGDSHRLTAVGGLAAMSLDALSSVAYGPEAIVIGLVAAGAAAVTWTVPIAMAIAALLLVLVVSYRQVIAVHPDGGGAYAVAKKDLGRWSSLLAAASLLVDYVLTVAVSLAAGAASLASVFPPLAHHLLALTGWARPALRDQFDRHRGVGEGADGPDAAVHRRDFRNHRRRLLRTASGGRHRR
jgi:hypothetical protein